MTQHQDRINYLKEKINQFLIKNKSNNLDQNALYNITGIASESKPFGICTFTPDGHYNLWNKVNAKCLFMRNRIQSTNQEELARFVNLNNLSSCNNHLMCKIRYLEEDKLYQQLSKEQKEDYIKKMLTDAKNYTIKH